MHGNGPDGPKKNKRKLDSPAPVADVSWTICCWTAPPSRAVPEDAPVAALKREIGVLREVPCFTIELFVKDVEDALDDARPLRSVDRAPLILLLKQASDRLALEALFKSTGGANWSVGRGQLSRFRVRGWLNGTRPLGIWHGVKVDEEGRATSALQARSRVRSSSCRLYRGWT